MIARTPHVFDSSQTDLRLHRWQPRQALLGQEGHEAVAGADVLGLAGAFVANDGHQPGGFDEVYVGLILDKYMGYIIYMG